MSYYCYLFQFTTTTATTSTQLPHEVVDLDAEDAGESRPSLSLKRSAKSSDEISCFRKPLPPLKSFKQTQLTASIKEVLFIISPQLIILISGLFILLNDGNVFT